MGLTIRYLDGEFAGKELHFPDEAEQVVLGRDPGKCGVVFPADDRHVSREHCAIRRELGRYYLHVSLDRRVFVGGLPAEDGEKLPAKAEIQLGKDGPRIEVERTEGSVKDLGLSATIADTAPMKASGMETRLAYAERRAKLGARIALAVGVLLVVGLGLVWHFVNGLPGPEPESDARLQAAANAIEDSVYLVILRSGGQEQAEATAWVVGDDVLATNAHVAELFYAAEEADGELIVRSCESEPKDFVISRVLIHPGYAAFERIWSRYLPRREGGTFAPVDAPPTACDVALMWVADSQGLAAAIPLAGNEKVRHLSSGDPLALVGYPMENMAMTGGKPLYPGAVTQFGRVTRVTTHFNVNLQDAAGARLGHLIQHSIPLTGGASGSPIIDADGEAVAVCSAINMIAVFQRDDSGNILVDDSGSPIYDRVPSGSGVNFAERVDLLRELLDGSAEHVQVARSQRWRREIETLYTTLPTAVKQNWAAALGAGYQVETILDEEGVLAGPGKLSNRPARIYKVDLPSAGPYQVLAIGADYKDIDLRVYSLGRRRELFAEDNAVDSWPIARFEVRRSGPVEVRVIGVEEGVEFRIEVHRGFLEQRQIEWSVGTKRK